MFENKIIGSQKYISSVGELFVDPLDTGSGLDKKRFCSIWQRCSQIIHLIDPCIRAELAPVYKR